jgi:uncharacterized surface protein with fasciclin (FAS1) repeats
MQTQRRFHPVEHPVSRVVRLPMAGAKTRDRMSSSINHLPGVSPMSYAQMLRASLISLSIAAVPAVAGAQSMSMPAKNIVETAVSAGQFNTLAAALKAAGLVTTLEGPGPFTVFAPTDAAFAKLPAGTVDSLLKPKNKKKLIAILTYHVVAGDLTAADVVKMTSAKTLNGQSVTITVNGGTVKIDDATVVKTDITASNGVIHVIDSVLMPK